MARPLRALGNVVSMPARLREAFLRDLVEAPTVHTCRVLACR